MPRPKRKPADKATEKAAPSKTEEKAASTPTQPELTAADETAEVELSPAEQEIAKLKIQIAKERAEFKADIKAAEKRAAADDRNIDFADRPPVGTYWYYEVTFNPKTSEQDDDLVMAGVNGKLMIWPRQRRTVIRSDYREAIDNAYVPLFKQIPGEDRKSIGGKKPYTYIIHRQIDIEEYDKQRKIGNDEMKKSLHHGVA